MHAKSETDLRALARNCISEWEHIDDARAVFRDEANAQYSAEDDGPRGQYRKDAIKIFEAERLAIFTTYIAEFKRWLDAPSDKRALIIKEQADRRIPAPDWEGDMPTLDAVMANGKRFRDCTKEDLIEMAEWSRAIGEAMIIASRHRARVAASIPIRNQ
jgi:hypothetical protein